ncbi:MAG: hypothetical protein GY909_01185 [Oligoflexia bacterium]|nr:hypothetical protein [Oligoflexia bacterium]
MHWLKEIKNSTFIVRSIYVNKNNLLSGSGSNRIQNRLNSLDPVNTATLVAYSIQSETKFPESNFYKSQGKPSEGEGAYV